MQRRLTKEEDELIRHLYVNEKKSSTDIGTILGVTHRTVLNHLKAMGIPRRSFSESQFLSKGKERPKEFDNYDIMYDLYVTQHKTKEQLGQMFNCAPHAVDCALQKLGIHIRGASEAKIGVQRGSEHHNWKGSITPLSRRCREFYSKNLAPKARERDGFCCQLCGTHKNLHVHHIVPFATIMDRILNEHPEYNPLDNTEELYAIIVSDQEFLSIDNLITYCQDCHKYKIHNYNKTTSSEDSLTE